MVIGLGFLFVFAQTTNVNSGGTVHMSRYALWLLPLSLPLLEATVSWLRPYAPALLPIAAGLIFNHFLHGRTTWLDQLMPKVSMLGIVLILMIMTAGGRDNLLEIGMFLIVVALLMVQRWMRREALSLVPG